MKFQKKKIYKHAKKHFPVALVFGVVLVISLYFANIYSNEAKKIADLQARINELSLTLSNTASSLEASTSASIASAIQAIPKPVVIQNKSQDELMRLAIKKISPSVTSINIMRSTSLASLSSTASADITPVAQKVGQGSGIIVRSDGYIITNNHVVKDQNATYSVTLADGTDMQATVLYRNADIDIAVIKIDGKNYIPATLGDSDDVQVGDTVEAIGNALGEYGNSVSVGIISGLHRTIEANTNGHKFILSDAIQTDAAINPGNSGGPLVDIDGKVIGINVATVAGSSNISFAIPINTIKDIISEVN